VIAVERFTSSVSVAGGEIGSFGRTYHAPGTGIYCRIRDASAEVHRYQKS
jgi:hypothetical protein